MAGQLINGTEMNQGFLQAESDVVSSSFDPKILRSISIFPNPVVDHLNILSEDIPTYKWAVIDIQGRLVEKGSADNRYTRIDMRDVVPGQYLMRIDGDEGSALFKIIKMSTTDH